MKLFIVEFVADERERKVIAHAIKTIDEKTCIRMVPRTYHHDYIHFSKGHGWVQCRLGLLMLQTNTL